MIHCEKKSFQRINEIINIAYKYDSAYLWNTSNSLIYFFVSLTFKKNPQYVPQKIIGRNNLIFYIIIPCRMQLNTII